MKLLLPVLLLALAIASARAGTDPLSQPEIDAIVVKFQGAYADAFNRRDAQAMAALLTENSTLQNEWGGITQGRAAIEALVAKLMAHLPAGMTLEDNAVASHSVAPGVIVSQGISQRLVPGAEPVPMFFSRVLVLGNGEWKLAATQIARPSSAPKP